MLRGTPKCRRTAWAAGCAGLLLAVTGCATSDGGSVAATPVPNSGFDVTANGFSFPNYTNEDGVANLDAETMRALFGDQVCARVDGDDCTLYPTAKTWMKSANDAMNGGHCFGMAGLSWAMPKRDRSRDLRG